MEDLKKLIAVDWNRVICNFHCPPFGTQLDLAPKLGKNLTVRMTPGGVEKTNVGSKSVRKFIETYQPFMGLHGHIHESTGFENLGRTICFNPGSEYGEGVLKGVILEISDKGLEKWTPISG